MKTLLAAAIAVVLSLACTPSTALNQLSEPTPPAVYTSLVCDRPDQVERVMELGGPDRQFEAIAELNAEVGKADACVITTYFGARQAIVGRIKSGNDVLGIVRVRVAATATECGLVLMAQPATWFAIEKLPESDL